MKKKITLLLLTAVMCLSTFFGVIGINKINANAAEEVIVAQNAANYDLYTNQDTGIDSTFKKVSKYAEALYTTKQAIIDRTDTEEVRLAAEADDPIVNYVPRELFLTEGKTFYIGKEYGFLVDSYKRVKESAYNGTEYYDTIYSEVMLFDIEHENNSSTAGHLIIDVKPVFQGVFAYGLINDYGIYTLQIPSINTIENAISYSDRLLKCTDGYIVAVPTYAGYGSSAYSYNYKQVNKYYLSNPTAFLTLFNENHLNAMDYNYNVNNDDGAFITQTDYTYKGKYIKEGTASFKDGAHVIVDSILLAGTAVCPAIFAPIATAADLVNLAYDAVSVNINSRQTIADVEKKSTHSAKWTNKTEQIYCYDNLIKESYINISSYNGDRLLVGVGDNFSFDYQITQTNAEWQTKYYLTMALQAYAITSGSRPGETSEIVLNSISGGYGERLFTTNSEAFELSQNKESDIYVLPNGKAKLKLTAPYTSNYLFESAMKDTSFTIYEDGRLLNPIQISSTDNFGRAYISNISLEKDKDYYVSFNYNGSAHRGCSRFKYTITPTTLVPRYNAHIFNQTTTLNNSIGEICRLPIQNHDQNYKIDIDGGRYITYILDENLNILYETPNVYSDVTKGIYSNQFQFCVAAGEKRYISISKISGADASSLLFCAGDSIAPYDDASLSICGEAYLKICGIDYSGYYKVGAEKDSSSEIIEFDENGKMVEVERLNNGYYLYNFKTYFIKLTNKSSSTSNISLTYDYLEATVNNNLIISSNLKSAFVKFVAPASAMYYCESGNEFKYILQETDSIEDRNFYLDKGEIVYVYYRTNASRNVKIAPLIDSTYKNGSSFYNMQKIHIDETDTYLFKGFGTSFELYDSRLSSIILSNSCARLSGGTYYIKACVNESDANNFPSLVEGNIDGEIEGQNKAAFYYVNGEAAVEIEINRSYDIYDACGTTLTVEGEGVYALYISKRSALYEIEQGAGEGQLTYVNAESETESKSDLVVFKVNGGSSYYLEYESDNADVNIILLQNNANEAYRVECIDADGNVVTDNKMTLGRLYRFEMRDKNNNYVDFAGVDITIFVSNFENNAVSYNGETYYYINNSNVNQTTVSISMLKIIWSTNYEIVKPVYNNASGGFSTYLQTVSFTYNDTYSSNYLKVNGARLSLSSNNDEMLSGIVLTANNGRIQHTVNIADFYTTDIKVEVVVEYVYRNELSSLGGVEFNYSFNLNNWYERNEKYETLNCQSSLTTKTVNQWESFVFAGNAVNVNTKLNVGSSVRILTIKGNIKINYTNFAIEVADRYQPLLIVLDDIQFTAPKGMRAIYYSYCYEIDEGGYWSGTEPLDINIIGTVSVTAGTGTNIRNSRGNYLDNSGYNAIEACEIRLYGKKASSNLVVTGGNGISDTVCDENTICYNNGGRGISTLIFTAKDLNLLTIKGGNGGNSFHGGGGGDGIDAEYSIVISNIGNLTVNGGNGGNGIDGAVGAKGNDGIG